MNISPLAPSEFPNLPSVEGVQIGVAETGMRYAERKDLCLVTMPEGTSVAGVFTKSLCPSAPVEWDKGIIPFGTARALLCNAGNANAFTGKPGEIVVEASAESLADELGIAPQEVFLASTGVIGEPFHPQEIIKSFPELLLKRKKSDSIEWEKAANAIKTTDTFAKGSSCTVEGTEAVVVGIAKGSGMIAPDMATMLAFIFTDLAVPAPDLQKVTRKAIAKSFNSITVDSDTSTSDTVLLFATGKSHVNAAEHMDAFEEAVQKVALDLAHQIVRDGEGATKFVEVFVTGATNHQSAQIIAKSIANSPLVKTALAAEDPNWGRIVMAVGKAGQQADRDLLKIWIGDELIAEHGKQSDTYQESNAATHLQKDQVRIHVDIGIGNGESKVWTCDLTHQYIEINAGYRS
ncbi:MAG: bifunctional glutamate N-acetyltransferase/amino-acid acetyltransferase ArgJ [Acidimicrobiales bacterium]|nr:bifunctional glutamate N-acetyltransferase/amino-acid acetyltransferase ArgJ [Acidimicrobiales bacterium]HJM28849.1 bifunctional glutamate N-acetyltransferase/amino-acid acetyltransferase ArgJ [Acidimicrobiales bacterium]